MGEGKCEVEGREWERANEKERGTGKRMIRDEKGEKNGEGRGGGFGKVRPESGNKMGNIFAMQRLRRKSGAGHTEKEKIIKPQTVTWCSSSGGNENHHKSHTLNIFVLFPFHMLGLVRTQRSSDMYYEASAVVTTHPNFALQFTRSALETRSNMISIYYVNTSAVAPLLPA